MASYNSVTLVGNIGQAPQIKQIGEYKVAELSLATSQGKGDDATTDWHRIVAWSPRAEIIEQYCDKGSRLLVRGSIRYRKYTNADGQERTITEIVAQEVVLLGDRGEREVHTPSGMPKAKPATAEVQIFPGKSEKPNKPLFDDEGNLNEEDDLPL